MTGITAEQQISSRIAGRAHVVLVPGLESGNMLAESLEFFARTDQARVLRAAKVPIAPTSRADSLLTRIAACATTPFLVAARRPERPRPLEAPSR